MPPAQTPDPPPGDPPPGDPPPGPGQRALLMRLGLRARVLLFFLALAIAALLALAGGLWWGFARLGQPGALPGFVQAGLVAGFAILGLVAGLAFLFDEHMARAIERLSAALRARNHAGVPGGIAPGLAPYLGDLLPAADAMALSLEETRNALAEAVARETTRLADEKSRLESLLADMPQAMLICSATHQLVFYNAPAAEILAAEAPPGLNRPLAQALGEAPLIEAYRRLLASEEPETAAADLLCTTRSGARLFAGRMRLIDRAGPRPGYMLSLSDITGRASRERAQERLLAGGIDRLRRIALALETAEAAGPQGPAMRQQATADLLAAVRDLAEGAEGLAMAASHRDFQRAADLLAAIRARLAAASVALQTDEPGLLLRCDGAQIVLVLAALGQALAGSGRGQGLALRISPDGPGAMLRFGWQGPALPVGQLDRWLDGPALVNLPAESPSNTPANSTAVPDDLAAPRLREILAAHASDAWPETGPAGPGLCLPLPEARVAHPKPAPLRPKLAYDFDLLDKPRTADLAASALADLTYVVFDSETTGLIPQNDEIVSLAGLRIVNRRRQPGEVFETLVDPRRPIPAAATAVHGITEAMVAGAPDIAQAGRRFHDFAAGAVLIAHNAPFDLAFLRRHAPAIGRRFDQPVLDTVLISAVVFGQGETHSLDALCHRLGITIPEADRHTALGDTIATAEAFLRMLPLLAARGIDTFGALLAAMRKHRRLLQDANLPHVGLPNASLPNASLQHLGPQDADPPPPGNDGSPA